MSSLILIFLITSIIIVPIRVCSKNDLLRGQIQLSNPNIVLEIGTIFGSVLKNLASEFHEIHFIGVDKSNLRINNKTEVLALMKIRKNLKIIMVVNYQARRNNLLMILIKKG
jgi:predicted O-methyltransferase YrrM